MPSPAFLAGLDRALRRSFGALIAILLGVAALLDAQGVMQVVAAKLGLDAKWLVLPALVSRAPAHAAAPVTDEPQEASADAVVQRNAFDSASGPLETQAATGSPESRAEHPPSALLADPAHAPDCDDVRVLVLAATDDPAWSVAALAPIEGDGPVLLRRRGGSVGRRSLAYVGRDRVILSEGGRLCQARLFEGPRGSGAARTRAATTERRDAPPGLADGVRRRMQRTGPASFKVDRTLVEQVLADPADLVSHARLAPDARDGRLVGIRLLDVRGDSLLGALGFQSDDRLASINGLDLTSPEKMMEAYARLRTADRLTVTVQRGTGPVTLDYAIR
jgi:general secretion pathway protein C